MSLVLVRVDNRLIHGQVLEAWLPHVQADSIIVVDDEIANDSFRKLLMLAVVPKTVRVDVYNHQQFEGVPCSPLSSDAKVLVLFATPADALKAYRGGFHFSTLNLGNMHVGPQKCCISQTLYADCDDLDDLEQLAELGVDICAQCIPTDRKLHWDCHCRELRA
ncbi:MAG: hypothetical protein BA874_11130 [Desulfuromonadales bacterium C00003068]|jgi:PTS system mannose-specific IIB component|nr:MAG: hypothetical protein BA874_11130 [Desulfuromonadales bacterium C00003068]